MKTQFLNKFLYEGADGGDGGGNPNQPTLADLSDPNYKPTDDVAEAARLAAQKAIDDQAAADKAIADYEALVAEAKNEDGTLKDGYIEIDGKVQKDPDYKPADSKEDEDDDDDTPGVDDADTFFKDVNKLHGTDIVVEYPEGVDPLSPEGVYHRDKVIADNAVSNFERFLAEKDPRSYAYMLHRQAGLDDDEFFSNKSFSLPKYETFKENPDLQVKLYKSSLINKGLDEDTAQLATDKAVKDGVLFDKADAVYKATEKEHSDTLAAIEHSNKVAEEQYLASVNNINQKLTTSIVEGKGMNFIIPDTDKPGFTQFVKNHVEYDSKEKKFLLVQEVGEDMSRQLEAMFLVYKKGDLKGLVKREAQTQNTVKLRRTVEKSKTDGPKGGDDDSGKKGFTPLGSL